LLNSQVRKKSRRDRYIDRLERCFHHFENGLLRRERWIAEWKEYVAHLQEEHD